jgi:hypothetical protein
MKNKIIEICELGQPQSIIHRENEPITELIKTDSLIEELNKQLTLTDVVSTSCDKCGNTGVLWGKDRLSAKTCGCK